MRFPISVLVFCAFAMLYSSLAVSEDSRIDFPANYREAYQLYLELDRTMHPNQTMRLFANDIAMKGFKKTGVFPNGSILVAEVYKAKKDSDGNVIQSNLNRRIPAEFALVAVMQKEAGWGDKFPAAFKNGDWDFAAFKPDGSPAKKDLNSCRGCHAPLKDQQHVFSYQHLQ